MKKRIIGIIVALFVLIQPCVVFAESYGNSARDSVAYLAYYFQFKDPQGNKSDDEQEAKLSHGSCFFIGEEGKDPQYLITNYHVVSLFYRCGAGEIGYWRVNDILGDYYSTEDNGAAYGRCKMRVYFEKDHYEEAYPVAVDSINDVAVFRLDSPTAERKPIALCSPSDEMVGSKVYAIGYPGMADNNLADSTSSYGKSDSTVTVGSVSKLMTQEGTGTRQIQIDCSILPGNSGGPLVSDTNGAVIGINTWSTDSNSKIEMKYAVNIDNAIELLNKNNITCDIVSANEEKSNADDSDSAEANASVTTEVPTTTPAPTPDPQPSPSTTTKVLIAVVAVLAAALIAFCIYYVISKKKSKESEAQKVADAAAAANAAAVAEAKQKVPVVRSLAEQHRGVRVNIQNKIITIGRSKGDCAIVFDANTRGVSSKHCTVAWDANSSSFVITDLQSTYGTYLLNGQKLTPGIAYHLFAGDRFYLGEKANMLSVEVE